MNKNKVFRDNAPIRFNSESVFVDWADKGNGIMFRVSYHMIAYDENTHIKCIADCGYSVNIKVTDIQLWYSDIPSDDWSFSLDMNKLKGMCHFCMFQYITREKKTW